MVTYGLLTHYDTLATHMPDLLLRATSKPFLSCGLISLESIHSRYFLRKLSAEKQ